MKLIKSFEDSKEVRYWDNIIMLDGVEGLLKDKSYKRELNVVERILKDKSYKTANPSLSMIRRKANNFFLRVYVLNNKGIYEYERERELPQEEVNWTEEIYLIDLTGRLKNQQKNEKII